MLNRQPCVFFGSMLTLLTQALYSQELPNAIPVSEAKQCAPNEDLEIARSGFQVLQALARDGNIDAMIDVAQRYSKGYGIAKDPSLAYKAYLKAAEAGSDVGMFQVALCLLEGNGVARSPSDGRNWLVRAGELNNSDSIGRLTDQFWSQHQSKKKGAEDLRKWSERGAELGIGTCQRILGHCHKLGIGAKVDLQQAFHWFSRASINGDVNATVSLAYCHRDGVGTPVNETKALLLFQEAASGDDANAIHHFAINIEKLAVANRRKRPGFDPLGFDKRVGRHQLASEYESEVVVQLKRAVELHNVESMNLLAIKYAKGQGCEKNVKAAFELAAKSARSGNADGLCLLAECYGKGIGAKVNPHNSSASFARAANRGSAYGQYQYGLCLASGFGIPADITSCKNWMSKSSSSGYAPATKFLAQLAQRQEADRRAAAKTQARLHSFINEMMHTSINNGINGLNRIQNESHDRWIRNHGY